MIIQMDSLQDKSLRKQKVITFKRFISTFKKLSLFDILERWKFLQHVFIFWWMKDERTNRYYFTSPLLSKLDGRVGKLFPLVCLLQITRLNSPEHRQQPRARKNRQLMLPNLTLCRKDSITCFLFIGEIRLAVVLCQQTVACQD